jgi:hypothetical protein
MNATWGDLSKFECDGIEIPVGTRSPAFSAQVRKRLRFAALRSTLVPEWHFGRPLEV